MLIERKMFIINQWLHRQFVMQNYVQSHCNTLYFFLHYTPSVLCLIKFVKKKSMAAFSIGLIALFFVLFTCFIYLTWEAGIPPEITR